MTWTRKRKRHYGLLMQVVCVILLLGYHPDFVSVLYPYRLFHFYEYIKRMSQFKGQATCKKPW